jgi:hypothetical protein
MRYLRILEGIISFLKWPTLGMLVETFGFLNPFGYALLVVPSYSPSYLCRFCAQTLCPVTPTFLHQFNSSISF